MADGQESVSELPDKGTASDVPLSFNDGVNALADFLDDQDDDLDPVAGHEEPQADEPKFIDDEDEAPPDDDGEGSEDEGQEEDEGGDDPQDYAGGRFASDDAKVTLGDGTVITVAELKRNNLFQRDYSKKTEEVARERDVLQTRIKEVDQLAETTSKEREFLIWFAESYAPRPPTAPEVSASVNPVAWSQYQQDLHAYSQLANAYQAMVGQRDAEKATQGKKADDEKVERFKAEAIRLQEKYPLLKDKEKSEAFWKEIGDSGLEYYGIEPKELFAQLTTAKTVEIFRDAMRYRAAKAKVPAVQKQIAAKPHVVTGSRRASPGQQAARVRNEKVQRLKTTGSAKDAVAVLMDYMD